MIKYMPWALILTLPIANAQDNTATADLSAAVTEAEGLLTTFTGNIMSAAVAILSVVVLIYGIRKFIGLFTR